MDGDGTRSYQTTVLAAASAAQHSPIIRADGRDGEYLFTMPYRAASLSIHATTEAARKASSQVSLATSPGQSSAWPMSCPLDPHRHESETALGGRTAV